jgi:fluoride exporter
MSGAPEFEIPTSTRSHCGTGTLLAVALGGALGGLGRHALAEVAPGGQGLPWATLAVNIVGALAVGILATLIAEGRASSRYRPFAITGVCGGLTTFSTVMTEVNLLVRAGCLPLACAYLTVTLLGGIAAAILGARLVRRAPDSSSHRADSGATGIDERAVGEVVR